MELASTIRPASHVFALLFFGLSVGLAMGCAFLPEYTRVFMLAPAVVVLFAYPEITLALYPVAGIIKEDPNFAGYCPIDLTLALGTVVATASVIRVARTGQPLRLPKAFLFYFPLILMMVVSLTYTPQLA